MARPKRTMAAAAQAGAALTRTAEVKKAEEVKKAAEPVVKEEVKETAAAVKEFGGRQVAAKDVLAQAEKEYAMTHPGTVIKSIELYISPEQNAAYYVVNGEGSDDFRIQL